MTTTEQKELGQEDKSLNEKLDAVYENLVSLCNIIEDITLKLNHQVISNCDILTHLEARTGNSEVKVIDQDEQETTLKVFQSGNIDSLIKSPLRLSLARLNGLKRVFVQLKLQVESCKKQTVSSGK